MIKILSLIPPDGGPRTYMMNQFFDTLPEGFSEVTDPIQADVYLAHVNAWGTGVDLYFDGLNASDLRFNLNCIKLETLKKIEKVLKTPGILWFDVFGVSRPETQSYPDFVKDIDIPIGPAKLPDHTNAYVTHFTDERRFFILNRYNRNPKHLLMLCDHLILDGVADALAHALKNKFIDKVIVPTGYDPNTLENIEPLRAYNKRIEFIKPVRWPEGVCGLLNTVGFYLSTNPKSGVEMMGMEAGFCGAQPIYPDIPFYHDMFSDTDVAFLDVDNKTESLSNILRSGYKWDEEKRQRFMDKVSGNRNLPDFGSMSRML